MASSSDFVPVAVVERNDVVESVHFGAMVGLACDGSVEFAVGNPDTIIYPRSANKAFQGVAMLRAGLQLPADLLALACASHDGAPEQIDDVRRILAYANLDDTALGNTADLPLDVTEAHALVAAGGTAAPVHMTCSGKHAAMVVTCAHNDWPIDTYLDVEHPLQRMVTDTIDELVGSHSSIGVDGCGSPAHTVSLRGLAAGYRAIATGLAGPLGEQVHEAMHRYPGRRGGASHDQVVLVDYVPTMLAKWGADGVYVAALADGRALALKIADGAERARPHVFVAGLLALGIDVRPVVDQIPNRVLGHGRSVGRIRSVAQLAGAHRIDPSS